ncbi:chondroitinase-B domain-containing protein [Paenibacillus radicis (ex Xue et al. 2023)]|uniref:Stalk domain-containing protein n=1 Tax=Paenibacillus radicis (ex Xue et al. 2023) TaxID=2972489 RepID=A0ABT1YPW1_9BACL|nr:chondroitinase-B domain-containing protein [Paenibacillus radicis (ex Xue et al. 2023)]MCR8634394.1 stalk domain-containing protein [Paenibacillus radicis (ex Xue et al. 2023)]
MKKWNRALLPLCIVIAFSTAPTGASAETAEVKVSTVDEIAAAMKKAQPGDTIVMKNGVWKDAAVVVTGEGKENKPITLRAETPGQVWLTGSSTLNIGGSYLTVDGLVFKNGGDIDDSGVIEFKVGDIEASHSRLTNIQMIDYNPSSNETNTKWVGIYGDHNRVDHSYFKGKKNIGATMVVWREKVGENYHQIDHNYFAGRPILRDDKGQVVSNEAETLRIGTSTHSLTDSYTTVEANLFENNDGEIEMMSVKSGKNMIRGNTFLNNAATVTLRHGNGSHIENNFFLANGKANAGAIRVIGEDHVIANNYISGIVGSNVTRGAITMTNGIPNSDLNKYFQVKNVTIANNTLVNNENNIIVGDKKSATNSLAPAGTMLVNNLVAASGKSTLPLIKVLDDTAELKYEGNFMYGAELGIDPVAGITVQDPKLALGADGIYRTTPQSPAIKAWSNESQAPVINEPLKPKDVGPEWLKGVEYGKIYLEANGKAVALEKEPFIASERTMVPVSVIQQTLGAEIKGDAKSSEITISRKGKTIVLKIADTPEAEAQVKQGTVFVPVRKVAESLAARVEWNSDYKQIANLITITP